jgi:septal ring-binding cell division protein DamX
MLTRSAIVLVLLSLTSTVGAFEPGSERICTPSADGQTFECREKNASPAGDTAPAPARQSGQPASEPEVATEPASAVASAPAPATESAPPPASKLPNYLLQSPGASRPISATSPASAPVADSNTAAPTEVRATPQESADTAATESPAAAAEPAATPSLRAETIEKSAPEPAPESSPAADTAAPMAIGESEPAVEEATAEPATEPTPVPEVAPPPAEIRTTIPSLPGASAFLALPATHYTLVLASVRDPAALDALVGSLDALAGQLFLIKLGMPDGDWYSLCWSEFDDMDAARAARASLPGDAAITSGWPRRIGPLQKEIAR